MSESSAQERFKIYYRLIRISRVFNNEFSLKAKKCMLDRLEPNFNSRAEAAYSLNLEFYERETA